MMTAPLRKEWFQLASLTLAHAVADTFVGIIAPVLVPLCDQYHVGLSLLIFASSILAFSSNIFQIPIGHLHAKLTSPILIIGGVLLAGTSVFMTQLPLTGTVSVVCMSALAIVAGLGVATVHPEGLRAVHGLKLIPSSLSTAIFMVAGFFGFAGGALLSSSLVDTFGMGSLIYLYGLAPLSVIPLYLCKIRLPIEAEMILEAPKTTDTIPRLPFIPVLVVASILAICSQIQAALLPAYLQKEVGYSLSFSGLSFTLYGLGGMVGAVTWGVLAPRIGHLRILISATLIGAPMTLIYLLWAPHSKWAVAFLAFTGFIVYTGFPLCITLARYSISSLRFGQRMGLASGGSWGIAAMTLWCLAPISDYTGLGPLLHLIWIGYILAGLIAFYAARRAE
jgi:FSR family fosmidomycin resistance protein-like MFS transporter